MQDEGIIEEGYLDCENQDHQARIGMSSWKSLLQEKALDDGLNIKPQLYNGVTCTFIATVIYQTAIL